MILNLVCSKKNAPGLVCEGIKIEECLSCDCLNQQTNLKPKRRRNFFEWFNDTFDKGEHTGGGYCD